jgi:type IV pilus assembly protein PilN
MIRINLLPQAKRQVIRQSTPENVQGWLTAYAVAVVVWVTALGGVYMMYSGKLDEQRVKNTTMAEKIEQLKKSAGNVDELKSKIEQSLQLEEVVTKLQSARLGPARVLTEMIRILSVGGGPSVDSKKLEQMRRENPLAGYNANWDPRRLWLVSLEEENRECRVKGFGKTNEDVAEFLRRLSLSDLFENVTLQRTESRQDPTTKLSMISFELVCKAKY